MSLVNLSLVDTEGTSIDKFNVKVIDALNLQVYTGITVNGTVQLNIPPSGYFVFFYGVINLAFYNPYTMTVVEDSSFNFIAENDSRIIVAPSGFCTMYLHTVDPNLVVRYQIDTYPDTFSVLPKMHDEVYPVDGLLQFVVPRKSKINLIYGLQRNYISVPDTPVANMYKYINPLVDNIFIGGQDSLGVGDSIIYTTYGLRTDGTMFTVAATYSSSNDSILHVAGQYIQGVTQGQAYLTAYTIINSVEWQNKKIIEVV